MRRDPLYYTFVAKKTLQIGDKIAKVRPLLAKLKEIFICNAPNETNVSAVESMCHYFGRHGCNQFIHGKPQGIEWAASRLLSSHRFTSRQRMQIGLIVQVLVNQRFTSLQIFYGKLFAVYPFLSFLILSLQASFYARDATEGYGNNRSRQGKQNE